MKTLKPLAVTPRGDWYRVKGPADIDQKLLDSIDWPKDKPYLNFVFPKQKLSAAKPLRFKLSGKYLVSINCVAGARGIKIPPMPSSIAGIATRPPENLAELKRLNKLDHKEVLRKEGKEAGYSVWHDYKRYEEEIMPKAKALLFYRKGKFSGLAVHFKSEFFSIGKCDHLGWHSDFKGYTPAERRSAEYQQALWMKKTAKRGLSVLLDPVPGPYYKFIAGLGLVLGRVRVERLG
jgi:hypothetical protein